MHNHVIGWDIGGAHIKAAVLKGGRIQHVEQQACPLWKGIEYLHSAVNAILDRIATLPTLHAVTMTGELVDCFESRRHGVDAIIAAMQQLLPHADLAIYAGNRGFLSPADLMADDYPLIASANWLASAALTASKIKAALMVDIGSTTTDIILLDQHHVMATGYTDYQRLVSGELLYTGVVRTAVMALCREAEFRGQTMGLMAEYFATMADVYRLTGELPLEHDQTETADGQDKSLTASAIRLSRMTGYEFDSSEWPIWHDFAQQLRQQHLEQIETACLRQLQRHVQREQVILVGAGVGRFLLPTIAQHLGLQYQDFTALISSENQGWLDSGDCAPAAAVAYLAAGLVNR